MPTAFQISLQRAARRNPAWRQAIVFGQDPDGTYYFPGGWRYKIVLRTRATLDVRPSEDRGSVSTKHFSHRLTVIASEFSPTWDFVEIGGTWVSIQRLVSADSFGATLAFDCALSEGLGPV